MAGDNLEIEIGAKVGDALSGLDKVGSKVGDLGSKVKTSGGHMDGFFGGITGGVAKMGLLAGPVGLVGGLVGELGGKLAEAAKAADEEQIGMNRLYTSMQANIKGWDGNKDSVEAYISKQQELAFGDDQLRDSLNVLVSQTHNLKQAQELQTTAMDLARAKKIDLAAATKLVGKVDLDSLGILKKLGIEVTDHMTKEQALAAIRQQTAGQAEAYANTTEGAMTRLNTRCAAQPGRQARGDTHRHHQVGGRGAGRHRYSGRAYWRSDDRGYQERHKQRLERPHCLSQEPAVRHPHYRGLPQAAMGWWGWAGAEHQKPRRAEPHNTGGGVSANSYGVPGSGRSGGGLIGDPRGPQIIEIHLDGSVISRVLADRQELRTGKRAGAGV
jgi:hypothetical protein